VKILKKEPMSRLEYTTKPMKTKPSPSQNHLRNLVVRSFAPHLQIGLLNEEFDKIKAAATSKPTEHIPISDKSGKGDLCNSPFDPQAFWKAIPASKRTKVA
jgi:hypothetical protein